MNVEERLRDLIIKQFGTMKEFTDHIGIPNSTFANILRRGVKNANVVTIIKICQALGISTDALAEGMIVPLERQVSTPTKIEDIIEEVKQQLLNADNLTLDNCPVNEYEIITLINQIDAAVDVTKKTADVLRTIKKEG